MKKTSITLEKKIRIYFLIVILVFIVGALLYNTVYGSLSSEIIQSINRVPASQEAVDQLQVQITDLMKEDAEVRHLKLHELDVKVISHQMLDSSTVEAIFDINGLTSLNYEKAEDSPVLKGLLEFKKQKQDTLSPSALELVDQEINKWRDEINRYIIEIIPYYMRMKAVGKIKEGKLDPATIEFYSDKGARFVEFFPYSLADIPSDEEVQQRFYADMEKMVDVESGG